MIKVTEVKLTYKSKVKANEREKVSNSSQSFQVFKSIFDKETIEHKESVWALYLNTANRVLACLLVSEGGISSTMIDPRIVFQCALKLNATAFILCHNHPSGNVEPSNADINMTRKIQVGGEILEIQLIDHLIITSDGQYTSMADRGII